jgi:plastocyanin
MNRSIIIASALLLAGGLTACSSSSNSAATKPSSSAPMSSMAMPNSAAPPAGSSMASSMPAGMAMITIKNFGFTVTGHITPGEKVMIQNKDSEAHTVTADKGNAFNVNVPASSTATLTAPAKAGTYKFHCNFHSNMHGSLTVA